MSLIRNPPTSNVKTDASFTDFESAPDSKSNQGASKLSGVRQTMPKLLTSSSLLTSNGQRLPFLISSDETNSSMPVKISGSQSLKAVATLRLGLPDQLMRSEERRVGKE